ncbi:unnamed protein product, partial [Cyprideis torosa]
VKAGAENMLAFLSQPGGKKDRKLLAAAQEMLADAKAKIDYIKMRINVAKENGMGDGRNKGDESGLGLMTPVEVRIEILRHHLRVESAVVDGAKNALRVLQQGQVDKKALQEVSHVLTSQAHGVLSHFSGRKGRLVLKEVWDRDRTPKNGTGH